MPIVGRSLVSVFGFAGFRESPQGIVRKLEVQTFDACEGRFAGGFTAPFRLFYRVQRQQRPIVQLVFLVSGRGRKVIVESGSPLLLVDTSQLFLILTAQSPLLVPLLLALALLMGVQPIRRGP